MSRDASDRDLAEAYLRAFKRRQELQRNDQDWAAVNAFDTLLDAVAAQIAVMPKLLRDEVDRRADAIRQGREHHVATGRNTY